jgi:hypothetical protein
MYRSTFPPPTQSRKQKYGNAFNAISVNVQNGVVTLGGNALRPVAADSAISLVSHFPGVQDVNNNIKVDPLSQSERPISFAGFERLWISKPKQVCDESGAAHTHHCGERQFHP